MVVGSPSGGRMFLPPVFLPPTAIPPAPISFTLLPYIAFSSIVIPSELLRHCKGVGVPEMHTLYKKKTFAAIKIIKCIRHITFL